MFQIAVCDDNDQDCNLLVEYVQELGGIMHLPVKVQVFRKGMLLSRSYQQGKRYDVVFLDMIMRGQDGPETAHKVREYDKEVPIIIVSASEEYALRGYAFQAWDYLVKPLTRQRVLPKVRQLFKILQNRQKRYFSISTYEGKRRINSEDIILVRVQGHHLLLETIHGPLEVISNLRKFGKGLEPCGFVQPHKSYLINVGRVECIKEDTVVMENKQALPLSKSKRRLVKKKFENYQTGEL